MKEAKSGSKKRAAEKSPAKASTQSALSKREAKAPATAKESTAKPSAVEEQQTSKQPDAEPRISKQAAAPVVEEQPQQEKRRQVAALQEAAPAPVIDEQPLLPAEHGKIGVFGGPKDRGIKPEDKLALPTGPHGVYERIRSLNPKSFYCAMRWNYHVEHLTPEDVKRWWANKKLLVTNSKSGAAVVVRAVDYGPHENTGLSIGVSPGALNALGAEVGDEVDIALADPKAQLGPQ